MRLTKIVSVTACNVLFVVSFSGCQRERFSEANQPVELGAIMALSGEVASYGVRVKQGLDLAVDHINADGGIAGRPVAIVYEDNQGDPTKAVTAFEKLSSVDRTPAIIGPMLSTESLATASRAERARVVQLSTLAGTIQLSNAGDFVFRLFPSDEFQGQYLAQHAAERFRRGRAAIIYLDNAYGRGIREVVEREYRRLGGEVVLAEAIPEGAADFSSHLALLRRAAPDLIFGLMYYNEGGEFLAQLARQGMKVPVLGGDAWFGPMEGVPAEALELLTFSSVAFGPTSTSETMRQFITAFRERYKQEPDSYNATGYDALFALRNAIETGGFTGEGIKDALYGVEFDGALGHIDFNENGDNVGAEFALFRLQDGRAVPVATGVF